MSSSPVPRSEAAAGGAGPAVEPGPAPRASADWALFLDVDGTLIDIAPRPDLVQVAPDLRPALERAFGFFGGALALISGRPIAELDGLFAPLRLPAAGQHGAEMRGLHEAAHARTPQPPLSPLLRRAVGFAMENFPGTLVEDKGYCVAVHYRAVPALGAPIAACLKALMQQGDEVLGLLPGKFVWEIRRTGNNKGKALQAFMQAEPFRGRRPVFIGDDITDEDGFAAAEALGGLALAVGNVGPARPAAFADAAAVRAWLAAIASGRAH